jgi:hypothetical protein
MRGIRPKLDSGANQLGGSSWNKTKGSMEGDGAWWEERAWRRRTEDGPEDEKMGEWTAT